ncbi:MAG: carbohydrate deacetylase [Clostridium sp.]|uniref:carbohydrate deacetylase n=1 Tax=Clostridium sp. TaxID=1506 RepID=UPI003F2CDAFE
MKLIINGDDFGLTRGISEGIIECIQNGIMRDTSAMPNMPFFEEAINIAKAKGINEMGIHLTMTCGKPVLPKDEVSSICDENGNFFRKPELIPDSIKIGEIEKELRGQINKFKRTGMNINHIDSHHHFYAFNQGVFKLVINLAKELNVPMRCPINEMRYIVEENNVLCPDFFDSTFYEGNITADYLINRLNNLKGQYNVVEFMAHPSNECEELKKISSYNVQREAELEVLTSDIIKDYIDKNNIELISYSNL